MSTGRTTAVLVIVLVVAAAAIAAFFVGVGPFESGGGAEDADPVSTTETGDITTAANGSVGGPNANGTDTADPNQPAYSFQVTDTERCGQTCRDVSVALTNNQDQTANNVTVFVRIFAGNSTNSEDQVWEGREDVGQMPASSTTNATKRVELSFTEGYEVQQNDGWITILTTVESDGETLTFTERRDVA